MIEKIIAFGTGERLQLLADFINKYSGFDVVEIWDNDVNKCGNIYEINGKKLCVNLPYFQDEYNIVVTTDIYFNEIYEKLVNELSIPSSCVKKYTYIYGDIKNKILEKYIDSSDYDINKICSYLQNNDLDVFCGQIHDDYPLDMFPIYKDDSNNLLYSYWNGKRIYLSSKYKNEKNAKKYLCSLCQEQDKNSPHCYNIGNLDIDTEDIVIDGGAAEGFFALQIIDKVKHAYLVECDDAWIEALKYTFEPYKDKVDIVDKFLDISDSEDGVCLDTLAFYGGEKSRILVKLDIEGKETAVIKGTDRMMNSDNDITFIICTYHKSSDAEIISGFFNQHGFDVSFSNGYMFFPYLDDIKPELRKGVLTAIRKQNMNNMEE